MATTATSATRSTLPRWRLATSSASTSTTPSESRPARERVRKVSNAQPPAAAIAVSRRIDERLYQAARATASTSEATRTAARSFALVPAPESRPSTSKPWVWVSP